MWKRLLNLAIILVTPVLFLVVVRVLAQQRATPHQTPRLDDDSPVMRVAAIRAMKGTPPPLELLHDKDPDVRLVAVSQMKDHAVQVSALRDPHPGVRREAAWGLAQGGALACPFLRQAFEDPHVRAGAAQAMVDMHNPKLFEPYSSVPDPTSEVSTMFPIGLRNDPDPEVRRWVFKALKNW